MHKDKCFSFVLTHSEPLPAHTKPTPMDQIVMVTLEVSDHPFPQALLMAQ